MAEAELAVRLGARPAVVAEQLQALESEGRIRRVGELWFGVGALSYNFV